jgi:hypothetical protein
MTYALRGASALAAYALAAPIPPLIALAALAALGLSGEPFHDSFHARNASARQPATARNITEGNDRTREQIRNG